MTRFSNCFSQGRGCGEARLPQPQPFFFALMGQRLPAEAQGETSAELLVLLPRPRLVASLQGQIEQGSFFPQPRLASGWHVSTFRSLLQGSAGGSKTLALPWGHPYDEGGAELSLCWEQRTEAASPSSPFPRRCSR